MEKKIKPLVLALGSATFLTLFTIAAWAQAGAQEDPPSRVGRLSYVQGQVSFEPAGVEQWSPAEMNRPLGTGDRLWADSDGRAAIQVGSAVIHLNSQTSMSFLNLNDRTVQMRLAEGDLNVRVRHLYQDEAFEIDTPSAAVSILRPGEYRLQVRPDGNYTLVIVRNGEAELTGGGQSLAIHKHQLLQVTGTDSLDTSWGREPEKDGFDRFCESRTHREERSESARYVSRDMAGYEDLDDHGTWRDAPGYGHVWYPRTVAAGWAPYHDGHWAWVDPWGWTWVDDAPWGFAPSHYGRWASIGGDWGWVPGPSGVEPVYAPALVGFVGAGEDMGWFPLGPGDVYAPGYQASPGYWNNVNRSNTVINKNVNITKIYNNNSINTNNSINNSRVGNQKYANQAVPGAVTAVPRSVFASGRPVAQSKVGVTPRQASAAQVMTAAGIAPTRQALVASAGGPQVAHPPASTVNRAVITKQTAPPLPVPFAQQQPALAANPGRPLAPSMLQSLRQSQPAPYSPAIRPLGPNLRPAPIPAASFTRGHLVPPARVQPPQTVVVPRVSNPDRPYPTASAQPNAAPRASNPDRPYPTSSAQPNAAPRAGNPDRPYPPPSPQPNVALNANRPDRSYQPPNVQSNATPGTNHPDRSSRQPPSAQPAVTAHASNASRPHQPSGGQSPNVASHVNRPAQPQPSPSVQPHAAPRSGNPAPPVHAQTHTAPARPEHKKEDRPKN